MEPLQIGVEAFAALLQVGASHSTLIIDHALSTARVYPPGPDPHRLLQSLLAESPFNTTAVRLGFGRWGWRCTAAQPLWTMLTKIFGGSLPLSEMAMRPHQGPAAAQPRARAGERAAARGLPPWDHNNCGRAPLLAIL